MIRPSYFVIGLLALQGCSSSDEGSTAPDDTRAAFPVASAEELQSQGRSRVVDAATSSDSAPRAPTSSTYAFVRVLLVERDGDILRLHVTLAFPPE